MANTVQLSYTGAEINRRLAQVMKNVSDLSENFEKDREFRENFANSSYVTSSALSNYALKSELPDVSNFATKEELGKLFDNTDTAEIDSLIEVINILNEKYDAGQIANLLNDYLTEAEAANLYQPKGNYQAAGDYVTSGALNDYATMSYVSERINSLLNGVDTEHDTLKEIVDLLNEKQDAAAFISSLASKADKSDLDEYVRINELPEIPSIEGLISEEIADAKYQPKGEYLTEHQDISGLATKAELEDYQPKGEYLVESDLNDYALKSELPEVPSIEGLATEGYVNEKISAVIDGAPTALNTLNEIATYFAQYPSTDIFTSALSLKANVSDLNNYALKSEIPEIPSIEGLISEEDADAKYQPKGEYLTEHQDISGLATKAELEDYQPKGEYLTEHQSLVGYATEQYVDDKISYLLDGVDENFDTLKELADALTDEDTGLGKVNDALNDKANVVDVYDKTTADGKFVDKAKYDELNDKYTTLFNVVYSNATGETATALNADYVANNLSNENTSVEITKGELGDVTIPETTKAMSVTAPMEDGATVTLSSPKAFTLINTSGEPVDVTIDAPAGTSIPTMSLSGDFETLTVNNGSVGAKSGAGPLTVTYLNVDNEIDKNITVSGVVFNDDSVITTYNAPTLGLANNNTDQNAPNATINAENSTVTLNKGQWNSLNSNVSYNTLIITQNAHINTLNVVKGNVTVYDREIKNRIDNVVNNTEYTVSLRTSDVTTGNELNSAMTVNPGIVNMKNDITCGRIGWGIFGAGNYLLDLQGHTLTISDTLFGIKARNLVNLKIVDTVGGGKFISDKSYGLWAGENTVITVDVPESTEIIGVTHTLYCEGSAHPTINVVNGTYKMTIEDSATDVYDANGNYKFMLNHYDATYTREGNCFNITGGIFYGFDPSRMNGDPGAEYSMIDLNEYESRVVDTFVDSRGTTMNVYKVVKK